MTDCTFCSSRRMKWSRAPQERTERVGPGPFQARAERAAQSGKQSHSPQPFPMPVAFPCSQCFREFSQSKLEQLRTLHIMNTSPNHPTSVDKALGLVRLISVRKIFVVKDMCYCRLLTSEGSIKCLPKKSTRSSNENTAYKAHLLCTNLIYLQKVASIK